MKETVFHREVILTFQHFGGWAYKIPDAPFLPQSMKAQTRFTPGKPCDIITFYNGIALAIECKQLKKFEALGTRHFRPSQIEALNEIERLQAGRAYVFLNIRISKPRTNRLIIIPWYTIKKRVENNISIKGVQFKDAPYFEAKKKIYQIESWLKILKM